MNLIFERLAKNTLGDPMLGVPLRQMHAGRIYLAPGNSIFIPDNLKEFAVAPSSHILSLSVEQADIFEELVLSRL